MFKKYFFLLLTFFSVTISSRAQVPDRPNPPRLVNNFSSTGFISDDEAERLEQKLEAFARETSNQIVIVIVDDFGDLEPIQYATELGRKWGVGQVSENNGIVILVKPTEKNYLQIAVNRGLEGAIPDITTKKIREQEMNPYFREGKGYEGLDRGTDVLMALAKGEYNSDAYANRNSNPNRSSVKIILIIVFVIIVLVLRGRGGRGGGMSMGSGLFWGSMLGGGRGFGGGGGSSGGFGGFGGSGGFSGGGSGGSW